MEVYADQFQHRSKQAQPEEPLPAGFFSKPSRRGMLGAAATPPVK